MFESHRWARREEGKAPCQCGILEDEASDSYTHLGPGQVEGKGPS